MSDIFSHPADAAADAPQDRADLRHTVQVPASVDHAWAGLTEHLHLWWPADELSRWGASSFFDLEDNALVETSDEDDENVWGEVTDGLPGEWLDLRWREVGSSSSTNVRFEMVAGPSSSPDHDAGDTGLADGPSSTLCVTHTGWTDHDEQDVYSFYREFWPVALARYQRFMGGS